MQRVQSIGTTMVLARVKHILSCQEIIMLPNIANKKNVTVNDRPYPVIAAGDGPLLICLHGFPDNYETWQHQIESFVAAG
jgi:hypothetical protein